MPRIHLIRHGATDAAGGIDPGLSPLGRAQAEARAAVLRPLAPLPVLASPRRRARETAIPIARSLSAGAVEVEPAFGEVPMPSDDPALRQAWLETFMAARWLDLDAPLRAWRGRLLERLAAIGADTVVVSHFVAINAVLGAAIGDDRVRIFSPDHCSCTIFETGGGLRLLERGAEGRTRILL